MGQVAAVVGEVLQICSAAAALLLGVGLAFSFVEGQIGVLTDTPMLLKEITPRVIALIFCLIVAIKAPAIVGWIGSCF